MYLPMFLLTLKDIQNEIKKKSPIAQPKVVLATDEKGNSYGEIDAKLSFAYDESTNTLIIYPVDVKCDL